MERRRRRIHNPLANFRPSAISFYLFITFHDVLKKSYSALFAELLRLACAFYSTVNVSGVAVNTIKACPILLTQFLSGSWFKLTSTCWHSDKASLNWFTQAEISAFTEVIVKMREFKISSHVKKGHVDQIQVMKLKMCKFKLYLQNKKSCHLNNSSINKLLGRKRVIEFKW